MRENPSPSGHDNGARGIYPFSAQAVLAQGSLHHVDFDSNNRLVSFGSKTLVVVDFDSKKPESFRLKNPSRAVAAGSQMPAAIEAWPERLARGGSASCGSASCGPSAPSASRQRPSGAARSSRFRGKPCLLHLPSCGPAFLRMPFLLTCNLSN